MLSTWPLPILRSAMSKLVEPNEQGKMFACIALLENACTLVASGVFNSIYPATRHIFRGFTFIMGAGILLFSIIILSVMHKALHQFSKYDSVELAEEAREEFEELDQENEPSPTDQEEASPPQEESGLVTESNTENIQPVTNNDAIP
ncbi:proton-coupled folate transporter-like [Homarus americanus]|uniref:proton-coupled folate transporter-like n=1 Tax=Homarus americanus TaxID=6706 RepID=UPI001C43D03F|nr:proton-coupled folate transporter-like [Homarus americanus]